MRREREITDFKPVDFFNIRALFNHENGNFLAQWKPSEDLFNQPNETLDAEGKILSPTAFDSEGRLINKNVAEDFIKKFSTAPLEGKISSYKTAEKKESQPLPFSLSTLQIAAGKAFGYTPQEVLDAAQSLYEKKFTTYPRSDCEYLPTTQFKDAEKILSHLQKTGEANLQQLVAHADAGIKSRAWNDKKISAHHAIIPTLKPMTGGVSAIEQNIYNLIAKNYAVQFYPLHVYDETTVVVSYKDEIFTARGKVVKEIGWREFYIASKAKSEDEIELLPKMSKGDKVDCQNAELKKSTTKPPVRFTASSLVQGMKDIHKYVKNPESKKQLKDVYGIGTEATRATIIEDLIKRGFLKFMTGKNKKNLQPTEKAFMLIDALPDEMTYPDATAIWEDKLHSMSEGDGTLEDFLAGQIKFTTELVAKAEHAEIKVAEGTFFCPQCKSAMVKRQGKNGIFWGCSNYPSCKFTCEDKDGKPIFESTGVFHCPTCGSGIMIKRKGKFGDFWGCNNYPECKTIFKDYEGKPDFEGKKKSASKKNFGNRNNFNNRNYSNKNYNNRRNYNKNNAPFNPDDFFGGGIISSADF